MSFLDVKYRKIRGQASVEMALALVFGILPLTIGLIAFAEAAWTYHGLATITRLGARSNWAPSSTRSSRSEQGSASKLR